MLLYFTPETIFRSAHSVRAVSNVGARLSKMIYQTQDRFLPGGSTPYIRMIGMIVVFFRGFNRRFSKF